MGGEIIFLLICSSRQSTLQSNTLTNFIEVLTGRVFRKLDIIRKIDTTT